MVDIAAYRELGAISDIPPNERAQYIRFLKITYKDNLFSARRTSQ